MNVKSFKNIGIATLISISSIGCLTACKTNRSIEKQKIEALLKENIQESDEYLKECNRLYEEASKEFEIDSIAFANKENKTAEDTIAYNDSQRKKSYAKLNKDFANMQKQILDKNGKKITKIYYLLKESEKKY